MSKRKAPPAPPPPTTALSADRLLGELRELIEAARTRVATAANVELTLLYWRIGRRIHADVLSGERASYGEEILATLSRQLVVEYGRGFAEKNLRRMVQFAEVFPDDQIVVTLSRQLSWSHFLAILPLKHPLQREYYAEMCRIERWSVRTLRARIGSMLYERTALSRKPEELIERELTALREAERMTPDLVMRDPYMLDFLDLHDSYAEADLEAAIVREMERFLLELGAGFTFVARQKRISVDGDDYYLDLLFYNRKLRRLVAVELKVGEFRPESKGQMELYLRWLDKYEREHGEESPLGIILCTGKKAEQIELLELGRSGIHVAEYLTALPAREVLAEKLHQAAERARRQVEQRARDEQPATPERPALMKPKEGPSAPKKRGGRRS
jgi:predicted nuclease of restriction endonuclease-like (RecB) superfamily